MPASLALLLVVVAGFGVAWSLVVPPWHGPDEIQHFAYVQSLAEEGRLPGRRGRPLASSELVASIRRTNVDAVVLYTFAHPEWSAAKEREWDRVQPRLVRDDGGGPSPAAGAPPFYYAFAAVAYRTQMGGDLHARLSAVRLGGILPLLITTVGVWLLVGELFGRRRLWQLVAAATAGLWPMVSFVAGTVTPDALLYTLCTFSLYLGVVILRRGLTLARAVTLGAVVGLALVTKSSALAFVPGALLALAWAGWRADRLNRPRAIAAVLLGVVVLALPSVIWGVARGKADSQIAGIAGGGAALNPREFASYLWQFYLPPLPFMTAVSHHTPVISERPLLNTWIGMGWAVFGWVNVWFPRPVYWLFGGVTALVALAALWAAVRGLRRGPPPGVRAPVVYLGLASLATLAGLHWTDYGYYAGRLGPFMQGRYLFPLVGVGAAVVVVAMHAVPAGARRVAAGAWLGGLLGLQIGCLALALTRWYA